MMTASLHYNTVILRGYCCSGYSTSGPAGRCQGQARRPGWSLKWVLLPFWVPHVPNQTMFIGKIAIRQGTYDRDKPSRVAKSYPLGGTPKGPSPNSHETGPMERNVRCPVGSFATSWLQSCLRGVKTNHCFEHLCASHDAFHCFQHGCASLSNVWPSSLL